MKGVKCFIDELPVYPIGIVCAGCNEAFLNDELITIVNGKPYCSTNCFVDIQCVEYATTESLPASEELVEDLLKDQPESVLEIIRKFADIYEIDLKV